MSKPPFHIPSILFDYLIAFAAFLIAAALSILMVSLTVKNSRDHWQTGIFILNILWSFFFYLMRRRFSFKIMLLQALASILITGLTIYIGFSLLDQFHDAVNDVIIYMVLFLIPTVLVFTKHASDKYIIEKKLHTPNKL